MDDGTPFTIAGKAFHSIYFEVLGELGFPGFIILMSMFAITLMNLVRIRNQTRDDPDLAWLHDLSRALIMSLTIYLIGGAFVGVAFQALHYTWMSVTVAMGAYLHRYLLEAGKNKRVVQLGWSRGAPVIAGSGVPAGSMRPRSG